LAYDRSYLLLQTLGEPEVVLAAMMMSADSERPLGWRVVHVSCSIHAADTEPVYSAREPGELFARGT